MTTKRALLPISFPVSAFQVIIVPLNNTLLYYFNQIQSYVEST